MMRFLAALIALSFAATAAAPTAAEAKTKKKRVQPSAERAYSGSRNGYQEFIAEKRPFGSESWWQQMDREGRGGQSQIR